MSDSSGLFEAEAKAEATAAWAVPFGWERGDVSTCRSCAAPIMWCRTPRNLRAPINPDGTSHFATCPQADAWRKRA